MFEVSVEQYRVMLGGVLAPLGSAGRTVDRVLDRHAVGLRLAEPLVAADDLPRFDNSAMDGYAVGSLVGQGSSAVPRDAVHHSFRVVGDVPAGSVHDGVVGPGEAVRIMTGARVPEGAVAVVPVESTDAAPTGPAPQQVSVTGAIEPGRHIRRAGEDVRRGEILCGAGTLVTPALVALARSCGVGHARLRLPVRVAVVATGAELTGTDQRPGEGGIYESNSQMVAGQVSQAGWEPVAVHVCDDEPARLTKLLDELTAGDVDLVVTTGGVSAGACEVVRQVCEPLASMHFGRVAMQPGAPQGYGTYAGVPVVCLPGTPVGAFVGFEMLLRPALDAVLGTPAPAPERLRWTGPDRPVRPGRVQFITAAHRAHGTVAAADSHHVAALAKATCLIEVAASVTVLRRGDEVWAHHLPH